jgi:hypothetical protein
MQDLWHVLTLFGVMVLMKKQNGSKDKDAFFPFSRTTCVSPLRLFVCWVTTLNQRFFNEFCVGMFTFVLHLTNHIPFTLKFDIYFFSIENNFTMSPNQVLAITFLSKIRLDIGSRFHFINSSFLGKIRNIRTVPRFPLPVFVRLFLVFHCDCDFLLSIDGDITAQGPIQTVLRRAIQNNPDVPFYAVLDRSANCPGSAVWRNWNQYRQHITMFNKNRTLYFNGGLIMTRNSPIARRILQFVISKIAETKYSFQNAEQDALWAFTDSSLYGILPSSLNCQPGGPCRRVCPPDVIGYHARDGSITEMYRYFQHCMATHQVCMPPSPSASTEVH